MKVNQIDLRELCRKTFRLADIETTRFALSNVQLRIEGGVLSATATDGELWGETRISVLHETDEVLYLPVELAAELSRLRAVDTEVELSCTGVKRMDSGAVELVEGKQRVSVEGVRRKPDGVPEILSAEIRGGRWPSTSGMLNDSVASCLLVGAVQQFRDMLSPELVQIVDGQITYARKYPCKVDIQQKVTCSLAFDGNKLLKMLIPFRPTQMVQIKLYEPRSPILVSVGDFTGLLMSQKIR